MHRYGVSVCLQHRGAQTGEQPHHSLHSFIVDGAPESQLERFYAGKTGWRNVCRLKHMKSLKNATLY